MALSTHGPWTHHASVRSLGFIDKGIFKGVTRNLQALMLPQAYPFPERKMANSCLPIPIHLLSEHPLRSSNSRDKARMLLHSWGVSSSSSLQGLTYRGTRGREERRLILGTSGSSP